MLIDGHRHYTVGKSSVSDLIEEMDIDGFDKTLLFGYNGMSYNGDCHSEDHHILEVYRQFPDRVIPFLCGFRFDDPETPHYVKTHLTEGSFRGLGEILLGHKELGDKYHSGIAYTDERVLEVFRIAGDFGVPVLIHADGVYANDFIQCVRLCAETNFIWAHCAYDFSDAKGDKASEPMKLRELLLTLDNLYFDMSMYNVSPSYMLEEGWLGIFETFSDRFLLGLDMTHDYCRQSKWVKPYMEILEMMSSGARARISGENLLRLIGTL